MNIFRHKTLDKLGEMANFKKRKPVATDTPTKKRVLVVDDEPLVCAAICMLLKIDGYEVETSSDGFQALAKLAGGRV